MLYNGPDACLFCMNRVDLLAVRPDAKTLESLFNKIVTVDNVTVHDIAVGVEPGEANVGYSLRHVLGPEALEDARVDAVLSALVDIANVHLY